MERPILFNGDMVRAILEDKKTQTRRVVKPQPSLNCDKIREILGGFCDEDGKAFKAPCHPGDLLWVREKFLIETSGSYRFDAEGLSPGEYPEWLQRGSQVHYAATTDLKSLGLWKPSIHMPRWASRITLSVTSVRVERLNSISNADAKAEGVKSSSPCGGCGEDRWGNCIGCRHPWTDVPRVAFQELWLSVYGEGSLDANPWVWVIEFEVQK